MAEHTDSLVARDRMRCPTLGRDRLRAGGISKDIAISRWSHRLARSLAPALLLPLLATPSAQATPLPPLIGIVGPSDGSTVTGDFTITLSVDLRDETAAEVSVSLGSSLVARTVRKSECPGTCEVEFPMVTTAFDTPLYPGWVTPSGGWRGETTGAGGLGLNFAWTYEAPAQPAWVTALTAQASSVLDGYENSVRVADGGLEMTLGGDAPTRPADERLEFRLYRTYHTGAPDRTEVLWSATTGWGTTGGAPTASLLIPTATLPEGTYAYDVRPRSGSGGYGPGSTGRFYVRHTPAVTLQVEGDTPRLSGGPLALNVRVRGPLAVRPGPLEVTLDGVQQTFTDLWPNNGDGYDKPFIDWSASVRVSDSLRLGQHTVSSQLLAAGSSPAPLGPRGDWVVDVTPAAPILDSLSVVRAATRADEPTTLHYSLSNATWPVQLLAIYRNTTTGAAHESVVVYAPVEGELQVRPFGASGPHTLEALHVIGADGKTVAYTRDGQATDGIGDVWTHTLPFRELDLTVVPGLPREARARALPRGAEVTWLTSAAERATVSGYRITANPGGRTLTVVPTAADQQRHTITGLTNGTLYSVTVTPLSAWGDGPSFTSSARPMLSTNVFGLGDVNVDRKPDIVARHARAEAATKPVYLYQGNGTGGFGAKSVFGGTFAGDRIHPAGDTDPDRRGDVFVVDESGRLNVHHIGSRRTALGTGWGTMRFIDGGSDFSGDGRTDILAVTSAGALYLYRGQTNDMFTSGRQIGSGWGSMLAFFTPGDWSGDGRADVVAVDAAGVMWLYRGNGAGGFSGSRVKIGVGWGGFGAVVPMRDFNGDGRMDIGAVTMGGDLLLYPGNGRSGFLSARKIGVGWHVFF